MSAEGIGRRAALSFGGVAALAWAGAWRRAEAADAASAAVPPVQAFNGALLQSMRTGDQVAFARRFANLAPSVEQFFDLDTILRVSVGPHWADIPAEQRTALQRAFQRYTVANFVANFDSYSGQRIVVEPQPRSLPKGDLVVSTRIIPTSGAPTVLAYVMRPTGPNWKCVDILADGVISRVATQRSDFRSVLANGGGAALVASLQNKVATLSGGTLA